MDFFEAQDQARGKTKRLVFLFILAMLATGAAIYCAVSFALQYTSASEQYPQQQLEFWSWPRFGWIVGVTCALMVSCSLFKIKSLSAGGGAVARMLGGTRVGSDPTDVELQRYRNVVEEMAIAAGIRVPEIYVLENESSINAFAAGYTLDNAAVAVSRGCLQQLSREELQGVVAHEFSHILNGDMRINTRLVGIIFGILAIAVLGRITFSIMGRGSAYRGSSRNSKGNGGIIVIALLGLAIMLIGYIGVLFGRLIQSAISRQREYLADAAAVQFTRNPGGISNALRRIKQHAQGSRIGHPDAEEASHMFFANAIKGFGGGFSTHPPLEKRIKAIDPDGIYATPQRRPQASREKKEEPKAKRERGDFVGSIAREPLLGAALMGSVLQSLPEQTRRKAHDPRQAVELLAFCLDPLDTRALGRKPALEERFALIELALASLKHLSDVELNVAISHLYRQAHADREVTFEEQCLLIAVRRNLSEWKENANGQLGLFPQIKRDFAIVLSAIALTDFPDEADAAKAFRQSDAAFRGFGAALQPDFEAARDQERVNEALDAASKAIFNARKALIDAASRIAAHDDSLSETEQNQIRSLCLALACPLPR